MYVHTWKKYLPVIRILLKRSATADQSFNLDRLDFEKVNKSRRPLCSFSIELVKGRLSSLRAPVPGKDLTEVLLEDAVARELVRNNHYSISLNSKFELQIKNANPVKEAVAIAHDDITSDEKEKDDE